MGRELAQVAEDRHGTGRPPLVTRLATVGQPEHAQPLVDLGDAPVLVRSRLRDAQHDLGAAVPDLPPVHARDEPARPALLGARAPVAVGHRGALAHQPVVVDRVHVGDGARRGDAQRQGRHALYRVRVHDVGAELVDGAPHRSPRRRVGHVGGVEERPLPGRLGGELVEAVRPRRNRRDHSGTVDAGRDDADVVAPGLQPAGQLAGVHLRAPEHLWRPEAGQHEDSHEARYLPGSESFSASPSAPLVCPLSRGLTTVAERGPDAVGHG